MDDDLLLQLLHRTADAVRRTLTGLDDWGLAGTRPGQYRSDLAADEVVVSMLTDAGVGVLSEESGLTEPQRSILVVVDPVDGSTNASRGIPWFATSLCALDDDGPRAAVVANLATGERFEAVRGGGARRDGQPIAPSAVTEPGHAVVGLSGFPSAPPVWRQYRALGAAALDLCAVACGRIDGYVDCSHDAHGVWDYLGGLLVCREAGAAVADATGRDLVVRDPAARRTPVAGGTVGLTDALLQWRRGFPPARS